MKTEVECLDCGRTVTLEDGWAEYEDGCVCLDCDYRQLTSGENERSGKAARFVLPKEKGR